MLLPFIVSHLFLFCHVLSVSKHPILLVVSYDAFSNDYFYKGLVPNMERLRKTGTFADYLINVFPTKTFPNHHSIATGLYPDIHGVIGNSYFNSVEKKFVTMGNDMYHYSESTVPIWVRIFQINRNDITISEIDNKVFNLIMSQFGCS